MDAINYDKEIVYLVMQFLKQANLQETLHKFEMESTCFFDVQYFDTLILDGKWDEAQKYFLSFTMIDDHPFSVLVLFRMKKQKYLEALDRQDMTLVVDMLKNELKELSTFNPEQFNDLTDLLIMKNFREHPEFATYSNMSEARNQLVGELKMLFMAHPIICKKAQLPVIEKDRLKTLMSQSLKWKNFLCANFIPCLTLGSLFDDNCCPTHIMHQNTGSTSGQKTQNFE